VAVDAVDALDAVGERNVQPSISVVIGREPSSRVDDVMR
jgi:hypothetical protein